MPRIRNMVFVLALAALAALAACGRRASDDSREGAQALIADPAVTAIEGAEPPTLADDEWLRYQVISLAKGCRGNHRFVVHKDGSVYLARNQRTDCAAPERFDVPYPTTPTATLDVEARSRLVLLIGREQLLTLAPGWRSRAAVDDGAMEILDVATPGDPHRIVVRQGEHPALKALYDEVMGHVPR